MSLATTFGATTPKQSERTAENLDSVRPFRAAHPTHDDRRISNCTVSSFKVLDSGVALLGPGRNVADHDHAASATGSLPRRSGDAPVLSEVANPSSSRQDAPPCYPIGCAPAAAPYRGSGLVL